MTHRGSHHKSQLPQLPRGENVLGTINLSAATYAGLLAGSPLVARAAERYAARERRWRTTRDASLPALPTAHSRHQARRRERRHLAREEEETRTE